MQAAVVRLIGGVTTAFYCVRQGIRFVDQPCAEWPEFLIQRSSSVTNLLTSLSSCSEGRTIAFQAISSPSFFHEQAPELVAVL